MAGKAAAVAAEEIFVGTKVHYVAGKDLGDQGGDGCHYSATVIGIDESKDFPYEVEVTIPISHMNGPAPYKFVRWAGRDEKAHARGTVHSIDQSNITMPVEAPPVVEEGLLATTEEPPAA